MKMRSIIPSILSAGLLAGLLIILFSCGEKKNPQTEDIVGAWKGKVQFKTGLLLKL
jgi:hypothetical protein